MFYICMKQQAKVHAEKQQNPKFLFDRYKSTCYNLNIKIKEKGFIRRWQEINSQILKFSNSQILKFSNSQILRFNLLLGKIFILQHADSTNKNFSWQKIFFKTGVDYGF